MEKLCNHLAAITDPKTARENVCEECIREHTEWVHLRTCQTCGVTLCCESSPGQHMRVHCHDTHHPVISSAEPGERWLWCYPDELMARY